MDSKYAALFKAIDKFAKAYHRCFVAECDFDRGRSEWRLCIRPTKENQNPAFLHDVYACQYIRLSMIEAEHVCATGAVPTDLAARICRELDPISG